MKTITVNLRADIISVITCADILTNTGVDTSQQPMSTTVRTALETLTEFIRSTSPVPDYNGYTDDQLIERYNELFREQLKEVKDMDFTGLDDFMQKKQSIPSTAEELADRVAAEIEGPTPISLNREAGPDVPMPTTKTDIFQIPGMDWDEILIVGSGLQFIQDQISCTVF